MPLHIATSAGLEAALRTAEDIAFAVDLAGLASGSNAPAEVRIGGHGRFEFGLEVPATMSLLALR